VHRQNAAVACPLVCLSRRLQSTSSCLNKWLALPQLPLPTVAAAAVPRHSLFKGADPAGSRPFDPCFRASWIGQQAVIVSVRCAQGWRKGRSLRGNHEMVAFRLHFCAYKITDSRRCASFFRSFFAACSSAPRLLPPAFNYEVRPPAPAPLCGGTRLSRRPAARGGWVRCCPGPVVPPFMCQPHSFRHGHGGCPAQPTRQCASASHPSI